MIVLPSMYYKDSIGYSYTIVSVDYESTVPRCLYICETLHDVIPSTHTVDHWNTYEWEVIRDNSPR